jgi:thiamine biosynthesis lipoprotein
MKQVVVVLFLLPLSVAAGELLRLEESLDSMGSTYSVVVYGEDRVKMESAVEQSLDEVRRLDVMLSNYRPESEWSQVNRHAAERPVKVSDELFQLLSACLEYSRQSEGAFDISVGPLMKVWGFYKGTGRLPHRAEIRDAISHIGYQHVLLDERTKTVRFDRSGIELDPGGIGKGFAVDRVVSILRENGIRIGLVSAAGSSIYALGVPPNETAGWPVKIRDPKHPEQTIAEIPLKDESMSTSGNYEKFFYAEGKIYSHIMDPRTGYPAQGVVSVSVIAPQTLDSEAWAKPYFINGRDWTAKHKPKEFRVFLCEDKAGQACGWLQ